MPAVVVVGAQWGDEGKGKVTDFLAAQVDYVVRYQGGSNAGHTVVANGKTFRLHLLPSGVVHHNTQCVIGNGVVVDPLFLCRELEELRAHGITPRLWISDRAHVVLPYHRLLDRLEEEQRGDGRIGTTGLGIGPAYVDKVARSGIRMAEFVEPELFRRRLAQVLPLKNKLLRGVYGVEGFTVEGIMSEMAQAAEALRPLVTDTSVLLNDALAAGRRILLEGAQGSLLDIDHGTYPFVTSSQATAGGAAPGSGIGPNRIDRVIGVVKAYTTRVGAGPFPTEQDNEVGAWIRERGREYGTTTGRPRRCGWFDAVVVRHAVRVNGIDAMAVMSLDVLSGLDSVRICVGYRYRGRELRSLPASLEVLQECEPIYEELPGWQEDLSGVRTLADMPASARRYVERLAELAGVPLALVSVGPSRDQTVICQELF